MNRSPEDIERELAEKRQRMTETVDQLVDELDPKANLERAKVEAKEKLSNVSEEAKEKFSTLGDDAKVVAQQVQREAKLQVELAKTGDKDAIAKLGVAAGALALVGGLIIRKIFK